MRVQLPSFNQGQYTNNIASLYSIREFLSGLSAPKRRGFDEFVDSFCKSFPLDPIKSEDKVVSAVLKLLELAGWDAKDRRSTFLPNSELKPDIWLDENTAYLEVMKLTNSKLSSEWNEHCRRCVSYARRSISQIAICTDGRRWFFVSTTDGEPKTAFIDLKRYDLASTEVRSMLALLWRSGPLYDAAGRKELGRVTELSKSLFKRHILKSVKSLDDEYREFFGLLAACAYAHYNGSKIFEEEKTEKLFCSVHKKISTFSFT